MLHRITSWFCVAATSLGASVSAQTETSPLGFLNSEANSSLTDLCATGAPSSFRTFYRQVDGTLVGIPARTLATLKMRRDGASATNTTAVARNVKFSVRLAHADYAKVKSAVDQPDTDWLASAWATVMADKTIALPDLRTQPASAPGPWSVVLPLDTPFGYSGQKALAFDFQASQSDQQTTLAYGLDRYFQFGFNRNGGSVLGVGCIATGRNYDMSHGATITHYGDGPTPGDLSASLLQGIPNAACWALLGVSNVNASLGLCEKLYSSAEVVVSAPPVNAGGLAQASLRFPITAGVIGAKVYTQMVIADPGKSPIAVSLSNGLQTAVPTAPVFQKSVAWSLWWSTSPTWQSSSYLRKDGGLVIGM